MSRFVPMLCAGGSTSARPTSALPAATGTHSYAGRPSSASAQRAAGVTGTPEPFVQPASDGPVATGAAATVKGHRHRIPCCPPLGSALHVKPCVPVRLRVAAVSPASQLFPPHLAFTNRLLSAQAWDAASFTTAEVQPPGDAAGATGSGSGRAASDTYAACVAACAEAVAADSVAVGSRKGGVRGSGKGRGRMVTRSKPPSACNHLHALSQAVAQRGPLRPKSAGATPSSKRPSKGGVPSQEARAGVAALAQQIEALQHKIRAREADGAESSRLARVIGDEFGARAASTYSALVKQSIAGVRRAETLEVTRGVAAERNARRDARISALRQARTGAEITRSQSARAARVASKEELSYRALYAHALQLEKERLLLEVATSEEARRRILRGRRTRQAALEHFHNEQLSLLQEALATETAERAFRERVQRQMATRLDMEVMGQ